MALSQDMQREIYEQYAHRIYRFCLLRLNGDVEGAKDVTQETFLFLTQLQNELHQDNMGGWVYKTAAILCKKYVHSKMKRFKQAPYILDENVPDRDENMPDMKAERKEELRQAYKVLQKLSPEERILFNAYFINGVSYTDLAAYYNISEATVRRRIWRLRRSIKYFLDDL